MNAHQSPTSIQRHLMALMTAAWLIATAACVTRDDARDNDTVQGAARDTVVIDAANPTCTSCSIDIGPPTQLGTPTDREIPQRVPDILRDGRGNHYLVFDGWIDKPILRYDSTGGFVGKVGSTGQGPGEYVMVTRALVTPGDSLLLILPSRRGMVFAPDGSYARVVQLTAARHSVFAVAPDGSGGTFATGDAYRPEAEGSAPHVIRIGGDGTLRDSFPIFSIVVGTSTLNRGMPSERQVALKIASVPTVAPDGSIWTITDGTRLEQHTPDGATVQLIGLKAPGRPSPLIYAAQVDSLIAARSEARASAPRAPVRPPANRPVSLRHRTTLSVDSAGMLWIVRTIPAPRYDTITVKKLYLSPNEAPGEATIPRDVEDRLYHTVVEVIDPREPALLARTELPFQGHVAAPGYIGRVSQDESGHYLSSIYRLVLRRR